MFITNEDYSKLADAVTMWQSTGLGSGLAPKKKKVVDEALIVLANLAEKKKKDNQRQAKYMAEKRRIDPTYGGADWYQKKKGDK